jgi:cell wall-associated NlpC family hydrolase
MAGHTTIRQAAVATVLASAVLLLCSARAPLREHHGGGAAPRAGARVMRAFEQHQLALRDSIVSFALSQVGTPYKFGGTTPMSGFDCSGLVQYVYSRHYLTPPRTAARQARIGAPIRRDRLQRGDILAFGHDSITHIGIYVGDRKFVHASSVAGRVIVSSIDRAPTLQIRPLVAARRVLAVASAD